ncbi:MAG TPA: hypothetical protein DCS67_12285 [Clostridiales bacterium UBA8960]|jgi:type IV pilus assembly protein PilC|nr:hypothetical protein [Clostridiales bacterium UBA8960]
MKIRLLDVIKGINGKIEFWIGWLNMGEMNNNQMLKPSELSLFCYQFAIVFKAGIPYVEGLHLLAGDVFESKMKTIVGDISSDVEKGMPLNEAIAGRGVFPQYLVSMLKIAEESGRMGDVFEQLSKYYEESDQLRQKMKSALVYPFVLIGLMSAVIMLLVLKVLPIFHDILLSVGGSVPSATQFVLDFSKVLQSGMIFIIGIVVIATGYLLIIFKTDVFKGQKDHFLMSFPIVNKLYRKAVVVKFARALSILTRSGMPIQTSLDMILPLMDNKIVADRLSMVNDRVDAGEAFDAVLSESGLFPELFIKMITLGQKTGDLDHMLDKIADVYDKELSRALNRMTVSIEPTMVVILSLVVGAILLLVMMPLINIMSSIG